MVKKMSGWKTKGMNRDLSVSAFNAEFAFENVNLRLSTNENNTLMSWVNEKGTLLINGDNLNIDTTPWLEQSIITEHAVVGCPVGTAIINHQLVIFTTATESNAQVDRIHVLHYSNASKTKLDGKLIFKGNLNFNPAYPLETHVSYEAEYIQKVYWTDGLNQPRLINIAASKEKLRQWNTAANTDNDPLTFFDFVPAIKLNESMTITKENIGGVFAPGVIQYCFTYINKYGQQSNVVDVSPLHYISFPDRAGSPEEKCANCFHIRIDNVDNNFDYVRIYAIQRTTIDTEAYVRLIEDLPIQSETIESGQDTVINYYVSIVDTGTTGTMMDPTELLYVGGREITALTMADKDNTLFMGNITQKNADITLVQKYYDDNRTILTGGLETPNTFGITFKQDDPTDLSAIPIKTVSFEDAQGAVYSNTHQLNENQRQITTFKGGETYRFGYQLQKYTGEWSEPVFLNDIENDKYPKTTWATGGGTVSTYHKKAALAYAEADIDLSMFVESPAITDPGPFYYIDNFKKIYKKIRPVIVFPDIQSRSVLCQGVLNPTVFNIEDRLDNTPFAQASWYFRPYMKGGVTPVDDPGGLSTIAGHYMHIGDGEIQGYLAVTLNAHDLIDEDVDMSNGNLVCNTTYYVDDSIVTLNSPDAEFDTKVQLFGNSGLKLRIVGTVPITANTSSHEITALSGMIELGHEMGEITITWGNGRPYIVKHDKENVAFGAGELKKIIQHFNYDQSAGKRLGAAYLWNDSLVMPNDDEKEPVKTSYYAFDYKIFPWHRTGSLNNDWRPKEQASSWLLTKKESNSLYSAFSEYLQTPYEGISKLFMKVALTENAEVVNYKLDKQIDISGYPEVNYYPNIDKVVYNGGGYPIDLKIPQDISGSTHTDVPLSQEEQDMTHKEVNSPVSIKYKSTTHMVLEFQATGTQVTSQIPMLPYVTYTDPDSGNPTNLGVYTNKQTPTFWGDIMTFDQAGINICNTASDGYNILWLGELYRDNVENRFGGTSEEELGHNVWIPAGEAVAIPEDSNTVTIRWTDGDTYYQRYDCLKTYAFTQDDPNQIVEMLSFMCETHVNIDGRYDKQRGQKYMHEMDPSVFNLINPVYTQTNNFFPYKVLEHDALDEESYPNQIYFTKTKENGADVDLYTNVTLASMLELDGDKGEITSIQNLNNSLIAFQDTGISQILYNENAQISTTQGVPIELANSGKVQGKRYITDTVGCSNKWSIVTTPSGLYFMDSHNKDIYLFNGQLANVSTQQGMNTWAKANILLPQKTSPYFRWNPYTFSSPNSSNNFVSYYDKLNQDVLFINNKTALAFSEKTAAFTSFYDYGGTPYFNNLEGTGIWVRSDGSIYKHQAGDYCNFFGVNKPYSMTLVGNPEPQLDKLFTNLEFRATIDGDGNNTSPLFSPHLPFDCLEAWNEYQHGITTLENKNGYAGTLHHEDATSALKRKFRIWRCDIPRDNAPLENSANLNIPRFNVRPLDRMRNPWVYLKLQKNAAETGTLPRAEIHDVMMNYFV